VLKTSVESLEGTNIKLTVTVSSDEVDEAINEAYARLGSKLKIPGFRKGRAPRPVVDNYVGKDYVLAEATEELINSTYPRAVDAESLRTVEAPEMDSVDNLVAGEEYSYTAEVELRPEFTLTSVDDFSATVPPREASEHEVDLQIELFRDRFATLEPVEDRGVEAGDFVLISFTGYVDGETYDGNVVDKYLYEMGKGLMPADFDSGIIGLNPGDEKSVEFTIPDTSSNPDFVGKTARFDVTVHEIKAKNLPPVDDEFAGNVGGFDSVDAMRDDVRTRLSVQKTLAHDREKETALRAQLAERLDGDAPEALVKNRTETMMRDFLAQLQQREMTLDQYLEATGVPVAVLEADINTRAVESVKEDLALEALFRAKGMEVTQEDIEEELRAVADGSETGVEDARARWEEMGLMPVVREQIMHRKAVYWLMENSEITEVDPRDVVETDVAEVAKKVSKKKPAKKTADAKAPAADDVELAETVPEPETTEE
jgi:trigger factor